MKLLFRAAERQKVSILSGDVHAAAAFKLTDRWNRVIYQLTSSAITYSVPRALAYVLGAVGVPDFGKTSNGYRFERLALYTRSNS